MSRSLITVDGNSIPSLTSFQANWNDADSEASGRSEGTAKMTRERIRASIWELNIQCSMITDDDLEHLQEIFVPEEVDVTFWVGKTVSTSMYAAQGSTELVYVEGDGTCFWNFSISLTEM